MTQEEYISLKRICVSGKATLEQAEQVISYEHSIREIALKQRQKKEKELIGALKSNFVCLVGEDGANSLIELIKFYSQSEK